MLELLSDEELMREYVLKKIVRYNHRPRLQDESVAEHAFFVSLICLKLMSKIDVSREVQRRVLILAALHDAAESLTSDIPHDVKKRYPEMDRMLMKIEEEYYDKSWSAYLDDMKGSDHDGEVARAIVKLADAYSVYQWCLNERELGSRSKSVFDIFSDAQMRIKICTGVVNELTARREGEEDGKQRD